MNTQKRKTDTSFGRSVIMIALVLLSLSSCKPSHVSVPSPDGNLTLNLSQEKDSILISIDYKGERLISPSPIGFVVFQIRIRQQLRRLDIFLKGIS